MVQDSDILKQLVEKRKVIKEIELNIASCTNMPLTAVRDEIQRRAIEQYQNNRYLAASNWLESLNNKNS